MREHLQVVAKECSKPIAKCVQLNTEDQTSLPRALETFIAKTVRGSVEAKPAALKPLKLEAKDTIKLIWR